MLTGLALFLKLVLKLDIHNLGVVEDLVDYTDLFFELISRKVFTLMSDNAIDKTVLVCFA